MAIQLLQEIAGPATATSGVQKITDDAANSPSQMLRITNNGQLCIQCKGKLLCGLSKCPVIESISIVAPKADRIRKDVFGPAPNLFVGHTGYPSVFAGPMVSYDDTIARQNVLLYDDSSKWFGLPARDIVTFRASFARGMQRVSVRQKSRAMEDIALAMMAEHPVDMEVTFNKTPAFHISFSDVMQPMGPSERFSYLRLASNPDIPRKIDSVVSENLQVRQSLPELLEGGFGSYYLQKLLSAGILGKKDKKKMVPTRWSITATDRMIADYYLDDVRTYDTISDFQVYSSLYLDNHFEILLLPGCFEFEQFESWAPKTVWNPYGSATSIEHEYEPYEGRSDYASLEGGGYYAGRVSAAEALHSMRRQAKVVIFREIGVGYTVPVGVWEVRENARNAFKKGADAKFATLKEAISYLKTRLKHPMSAYLSKSRIMPQSRLTSYM